jgi:hypothetical protein
MNHRGSGNGGADDPNQLRLGWEESSSASGESATAVAPLPPPPLASEPESGQSAVPHLKWDFRESFPKPLPEAIDAGIISDEDAEPENIRAIHQEQARALLATLRDQYFIGDARRRLFDPRTGRKPNTPEDKERLQKQLLNEAQRLELWWQTLIDTYAQAFGEEAAEAFGTAVRARNAGIDIIVESQSVGPAIAPKIEDSPPPVAPVSEPKLPAIPAPKKPEVRRPAHPRTVTARFPVPRPLSAAVAAGHFGQDDNGRVIRPSADEVRSITLHHSEKLIDLLEAIEQARHSCIPSEVGRLEELFRSAVAAYAEDFGQAAADQLAAFARRQACLRSSENGRGPHR